VVQFTVGKNDDLQIAVSSLFEYDVEKDRILVNDTTVKVYGQSVHPFDLPADTKDFTNLQGVYTLGQKFVVFNYNGNGLLFTRLDTNIIKFIKYQDLKIDRLEAGAFCSDALLYKKVIFAVCYRAYKGQLSFSVVLIDAEELKVLRQINVTRSVPIGESAFLRLRVDSSQDPDTLIIFAQGLKEDSTSNILNFCNKIYDPVNVECLNDSFIDVSSTQIGLRFISDVVNLEDSLLFIGKPSAESNKKLILRKCNLNYISKSESTCDDRIAESTLEDGYVTVLTQTRYIEIDYSTSSLLICNSKYGRISNGWNSTGCDEKRTIKLPNTGARVRQVNLINGGFLIELASPDLSYQGFSTIFLEDNSTNLETTKAAGLSEGRLIIRDPTITDKLLIGVIDEKYLLFRSKSYEPGKTYSFVIQKKTPTESVDFDIKVTLNLRVLSNYTGPIFYNPDATLRNHEVKYGSRYDFGIFTNDFEGNALKYRFNFSKNIENATTVEAILEGKLDISFKFANGRDRALTPLKIAEGFATGYDPNSDLFAFRCTYPEHNYHICSQIHMIPNMKGFLRDFWANDNLLGVVVVDIPAKSSSAVTVFSDSKYVTYMVSPTSWSTMTTHVVTEADGKQYGHLVVAYNNEFRQSVDIYKFDPNTLEEISLLTTITEFNTVSGNLCPISARSSDSGYLYITSSCPNGDNRIIAFKGAFFASPSSEHTYESGLKDFQTCVYEDTALAVGYRTDDASYEAFIDPLKDNLGLSNELFDLKEFGLSNKTRLTCQEGSKSIRISSIEENGNMTIAIFNLDSRGNALRRLTSYTRNTSIPVDQTFNSGPSLVHVIYDGDKNPFFNYTLQNGPEFASESLKSPSGIYPIPKDDEVQSGELHVTLTNPWGQNVTFNSKYNLRYQATTVQVDVEKKIEPRSNFYYDVDQQLEVNGPVLGTVLVQEKENDGIQLSKRLKGLANVSRVAPGALVKFISVSGNTSFMASQGKNQLNVIIYDLTTEKRTISIPAVGPDFQAFDGIEVGKDMYLLAFVNKLQATPGNSYLSVAFVDSDKQIKVISLTIINAVTLKLHHIEGSEFLIVTEDLEYNVVMNHLNISNPDMPTLKHIKTEYGLYYSYTIVNKNKLYIVSVNQDTTTISVNSRELTNLDKVIQQSKRLGFAKIIPIKDMKCSFNPITSEIGCICNTYSVFLLEFYITKDLAIKSFFYHQKYGFLEVMDYTLNAGYIIATAKGTRPGTKSAQICMWKSQPKSLNDSKIIHILDSSSDDDLIIEDSFNLPIQSFTAERNPWAYVVAAFASAKNPVRIFNLSRLTIYLAEANFSISEISLQFIGTGVTDSYQIQLEKFITKPDNIEPQDSSHNLFIAMICAIIFLAVASAVGLILYLRERSAKSQGMI
jgi:hypothetical protein